MNYINIPEGYYWYTPTSLVLKDQEPRPKWITPEILERDYKEVYKSILEAMGKGLPIWWISQNLHADGLTLMEVWEEVNNA
jgi:hypothetical protein